MRIRFIGHGAASAFLCAAMVCQAWGEDIPAINGDPTVRVAYVIPSNRTPQEGAVETLQTAVRFVHAWYAEEMTRWGFGPLTFRYETEVDGVTPKVHVVYVTETDSYLRESLWGRVWSAASSAGAPVYNSGEIWLAVPETHLELPDGTVEGGTALGGGNVFGSGDGDGNGRAMVGSDMLPFITMSSLHDETTYHGLIVPAIGPYPLVQDTSWAWFLGTTFSGLGSSYTGAIAHEMGHAFGLYHDFRNDENFHGNLMGNGLRGMRGCAYPDEYPEDFTRLSYAAALSLSTLPYFTDETPAPSLSSFQTPVVESDFLRIPSTLSLLNAVTPLATTDMLSAESPQYGATSDDMMTDGAPAKTGPVTTTAVDFPSVSLTSATTQTLTNGKVLISFTATDSNGLTAALLRWEGDVYGETPLSGTSANFTFETPYYEIGASNGYQVRVVNALGNATTVYAYVTVDADAGDNQAPRPFVKAMWRLRLETRYQLTAANTQDLGGSTTGRTYEWDLDGDGAYDYGPYSSSSCSPRYATAGLRWVRVRVTDAEGAVTVGTWLTVHMSPNAAGDVNCDGAVNAFDIDPFVTALVDPTTYETLYGGCNINNADANEDGAVNAFDIDPFVGLLVGA